VAQLTVSISSVKSEGGATKESLKYDQYPVRAELLAVWPNARVVVSVVSIAPMARDS